MDLSGTARLSLISWLGIADQAVAQFLNSDSLLQYAVTAGGSLLSDAGPRSSKAQQEADLRKAVNDAYRLVQEAHLSYEEAFSIRADTELSSDGLLAVRQSGQEYAAAVRRYSEAVMAWLAFMDTKREDARKLVRKTLSKGVTDL